MYNDSSMIEKNGVDPCCVGPKFSVRPRHQHCQLVRYFEKGHERRTRAIKQETRIWLRSVEAFYSANRFGIWHACLSQMGDHHILSY